MRNKLFIFGFILFMLFIGIDKINAASCDKYGCASCIYKISNYDVKYDITSNGNVITVNFDTKKTDDIKGDYKFTNNLENTIFKSGDEIVCPSNIYVVYGMSGTKITAKLYSESKENSIKAVLSETSTDNNKTITGGVSKNTNSNGSILNDNQERCSIFSSDFIEFMQLMLDYIRIAGLVLAVVLSIMDYTKAIFGSDDKSNEKANKRFATRLIVLALLFLIPAVINFVLNLFNIQGSGDNGTCGIY